MRKRKIGNRRVARSARRAGMELVLGTMIEGDLVFFEPDEPNFSVRGQRVLRGRKARHSHVAVVLSPGLVVHATPAGGVHIASLRELILSRAGDEVTVFRHEGVAASNDKRKKMFDELLFHLNKSYNYAITFKSRSAALFCSELAAIVYAAVGHPFRKAPWKMLPADLAEGAGAWAEVTARTLCWYASDTPDPQIQTLIALGKNDVHAKALKGMLELLQSSVLETALWVQLLETMSGERSALRAPEGASPGSFEAELASNWATADPQVILSPKVNGRRRRK